MPAGQSVTVAAQDVMVRTSVDQMVLVTSSTELAVSEDPAAEEGAEVTDTPVGVVLPC